MDFSDQKITVSGVSVSQKYNPLAFYSKNLKETLFYERLNSLQYMHLMLIIRIVQISQNTWITQYYPCSILIKTSLIHFVIFLITGVSLHTNRYIIELYKILFPFMKGSTLILFHSCPHRSLPPSLI